MSKSVSGDWYEVGVTDESLRNAEAQSVAEQKRFWMPPEKNKRIVMLDDEPVCIWEHNMKINGVFKGNWFTCRKRLDGGCPLCISKVNKYYIGFITVIDVDGFESKKDGKMIKNFRLLFPMKQETLKVFKAKKQKKTSLVGAMFDVTRTSEKSPSCGNDWEFIDYVDLNDKKYWYESKLEGGLVKPEPFDYRKILRPMSPDEMRQLGQVPDSFGDDNAGGEDDDSLY